MTHSNISQAAGNLLGFDFGLRRIGVAVGETVTGGARPLATLAAQQGRPDWNHIDELIRDWSPLALVVGLPVTLDGEDQPITVSARVFAGSLRERYHLPVHCSDERHSSQEASRRFAAQRASGQRRRRDAEGLDAVAAAVILESWLNEHS